MKQLVLIFLIGYLVIPLLPAVLPAQEKTPVVLNSKIGADLDAEECRKYGLFKEFSNLESARFYELVNGNYEIDIRYIEDGEIHEQVWFISRQEFVENYLNVLNPRDLTPKMKPGIVPEDQIIKVQLNDGRFYVGALHDIQNNSVRIKEFSRRKSNFSESELDIPVNKIISTSIVRDENPVKAIGIGLIPGAVVGLIGLLSGDDKPGLFSISAEGKGVLGFVTGSFIGLNISGTISALRSVDFDIPMLSLSEDEKTEIFQKIYKREVRKRLRFRINPWFAVHSWEEDTEYNVNRSFIGYFPGLRAQVYFTPRSGMEVSYSHTKWFNRNLKYYYYDYDYENHTDNSEIREMSQEITYFSAGYFTAITLNKLIDTSISWGWGYHSKKNTDFYEELDETLALYMKLGLTHHFSNALSVDMRLGPVTDFDRLYFTAELGISFGRFY